MSTKKNIAFKMPSLGADMESGFLREWKVKPGDAVKRGDIIAEVETQKGIIDIEVFDEGIISEILIKEDEKVPVGTPMAMITVERMLEETEKEVEPAKLPIEISKPEAIRTPVADLKVKGPRLRVSPLARRIAAEKGIDLSGISGSGPEGAITRHDVEKTTIIKAPPVAAPRELKGAEAIRMAVAAAMSKSNREIPHYYLESSVDMQPALNWLSYANKSRAVKDRLLPAVLFIKAVALALQEVPELNAYWEDGLQQKEHINIGFVVALRSGGIIVPAIRDADKKSLDELMQSLTDLITRSRSLRLRSSELSESTITITSLGDGGAESVMGVIYPPQVALLGFGGIQEQPWAEKGMLDVRPVVNISLAADHRATDGNIGSLFLSAVKKYLTQPEKL